MSRAIALSVISILIGCGGKSADQACTDLAKATCAQLDKCRKNGTADTYGSLGVCIQRQHDNCVASLLANGTGNSPAHTEACAQALPTETCAQFLQSTPVAACVQVTGALDSGAACAFSGQCQSGFCAVPKGSGCGTCATTPAAGDACDVVPTCGPGMACTPMQVCEPWVQAGGACDGMTNVCAPGSSCVIPAMMTAGTCVADATMVGQACDNRRQTGPACDVNQGLFCASTKMCIAVNYVNAGTACGAQNMGMSDNICTGGAACYSPGTGMPSMCLAFALEGGACDTSVGPGCMTPARCVVSGGGTSGTCALPDASTCM